MPEIGEYCRVLITVNMYGYDGVKSQPPNLWGVIHAILTLFSRLSHAFLTPLRQGWDRALQTVGGVRRGPPVRRGLTRGLGGSGAYATGGRHAAGRVGRKNITEISTFGRLIFFYFF